MIKNLIQKFPAIGMQCLLISLIPITSLAQSLPDQMYFNEDSTQLLLGGVESQEFYNESVVWNIRLDFYDPDFWQKMKDNYNTDHYVLATLTYDGETFDSVAVQFKGQTSYRKPEKEGSEKLSFSIKLDEIIEGQDIGGYNNFNLNNAYQDPSFMREVLYARLSRDLMPALYGNFVRMNLNGEDWGLYANIQQLNGDYIKEWFPNNYGIRWRADADSINIQLKAIMEVPPPAGGANWGDGTAALNYLGDQESEYQKYYTLKDSDIDDPWEYLINVCDRLNNTPLENLTDSLSDILDMDGTLWFLAQEVMFSDDDSYVHKGKMDYYLYFDAETGRMVPLEFDGNSAMSLRNREWSPFMNEDSSNYPLLNRLLAIPEMRQRYIAHSKTIMNKAFDIASANAIIDQYANLIGPHVQTDPKIDFTYSRHTNAVNGLRGFIKERRTFVLSNPEFTRESPEIGEVNHWVNGEAGKSPAGDEEVIVTASASHPEGIRVINLYYAQGFKGIFTSVAMRDDGQGADNLAGDGNFTALIPGVAPGVYVRFYIEAVADDPVSSVSYMPEGAEYDVFVYQAEYSYSDETSIVINEFMASNDQVQQDEYGEFDDWIEIHNKSGIGVSMEGLYLSDDVNNFSKWTFPAIIIEPGAYLVVWADDDTEQGTLHCNFKLSADGEEVLLTDQNGNIIDRVIFGEQEADISFGRWPNGTGEFSTMSPTFSASNQWALTGDHVEASEANLFVYPNPASESIRMVWNGTEPEEITIYSLTGQKVYQEVFKETLDISFLQAGTYILKADMHTILLVVK